jgi:hypothetical protein
MPGDAVILDVLEHALDIAAPNASAHLAHLAAHVLGGVTTVNTFQLARESIVSGEFILDIPNADDSNTPARVAVLPKDEIGVEPPLSWDVMVGFHGLASPSIASPADCIREWAGARSAPLANPV